MLRTALAALVVCSFLGAGCAHKSRRVAQAQTQRTQAQAQMTSIIDRALANQQAASLDPIRDKIYIGRDVRQTPLSLLGIESKPTTEEKKALENWHRVFYASSWPEMENWMQRYTPWGVPIFDLERAASYASLAKLYSGEITYGEFNRQRVEIANNSIVALRQREDEVRKDLRQQANTQQNQDIQQAAAGSAAVRSYSSYLIQQKLLTSSFKPARLAGFICSSLSGTSMSCF